MLGMAEKRIHQSPLPAPFPKGQPLQPPTQRATASMMLFDTPVQKSPSFFSLPCKPLNNVNLNIRFVKYQRTFRCDRGGCGPCGIQAERFDEEQTSRRAHLEMANGERLSRVAPPIADYAELTIGPVGPGGSILATATSFVPTVAARSRYPALLKASL